SDCRTQASRLVERNRNLWSEVTSARSRTSREGGGVDTGARDVHEAGRFAGLQSVCQNPRQYERRECLHIIPQTARGSTLDHPVAHAGDVPQSGVCSNLKSPRKSWCTCKDFARFAKGRVSAPRRKPIGNSKKSYCRVDGSRRRSSEHRGSHY